MIQIVVPAAKEKADGMVGVFIHVGALAEAQKVQFLRNLSMAAFVDPHYVIHDVSSHSVKVLLQPFATLRDIKFLLPNLTIDSQIKLGSNASHEGVLDDSFATLLRMANERDRVAIRPAPRL